MTEFKRITSVIMNLKESKPSTHLLVTT